MFKDSLGFGLITSLHVGAPTCHTFSLLIKNDIKDFSTLQARTSVFVHKVSGDVKKQLLASRTAQLEKLGYVRDQTYSALWSTKGIHEHDFLVEFFIWDKNILDKIPKSLPPVAITVDDEEIPTRATTSSLELGQEIRPLPPVIRPNMEIPATSTSSLIKLSPNRQYQDEVQFLDDLIGDSIKKVEYAPPMGGYTSMQQQVLEGVLPWRYMILPHHTMPKSVIQMF